jgi:hypothetical protein
MKTEAFGCPNCWPSSANSAWDAYLSLSTEVELVDDVHFMVKIRSCAECRQRFVAVFTETIDWIDGEDPQFWTVLPITKEETATLSQSKSTITSVLKSLAPQRRSFRAQSSIMDMSGNSSKSWLKTAAAGRLGCSCRRIVPNRR